MASGAYSPIADYALISDCHAAALVSRSGSVDWCCMPRLDSGACFARLLDAETGGHCSIEPDGAEGAEAHREYVEGTLVLATVLRTDRGQARVIDCFTIEGDDDDPAMREHRELVRVVEGERGSFECALEIVPRFDYGEVDAWLRRHGRSVYSAIGGDDGLCIWSDAPLEAEDRHRLRASTTVGPGERWRLSLRWMDPAELDEGDPLAPSEPGEVDQRVEETIAWWRRWSERPSPRGPDAPGVARSAMVLKGLTYAPTGAIAAAATTSLPENRGGERTWDYRYSWVRDSALAARSLAEFGCEREADGSRRFMERSAAGNAKDLQVLYGLGGERRLIEQTLDHLEGYGGARPVRVGNNATNQFQLDAYGHLLDQSWRWYLRGHEPDDDYWRFLVELVDAAAERWQEPDAGIWEWRGDPKHFVHSKVLAWVAVDRGLRLAETCMRKAPERRWRAARNEIREAIERRGYDRERGVFVQAFDSSEMDGALLRIPTVEFVDYDDERMVRTTDAVREELEVDGLLRRYKVDDEIGGPPEGTFVPCSFWLAECLARQGRLGEARTAFDRAIAAGNDLGLFSEEYDPKRGEMLGNFPQALTHLSHIEAAVALADAEDAVKAASRRSGEGSESGLAGA